MGRKLGFSFSLKRAVGISGMKNRVSRRIGIPLTRSGRQRKVGRLAGCFVATATYGSYDSANVRFFRAFRDNILEQYYLGRLFIDFYYIIGPYFALIVSKSKLLKLISRRSLNLLIKLIENTSMLRLKDYEK
jgi:hypothetical protein